MKNIGMLAKAAGGFIVSLILSIGGISVIMPASCVLAADTTDGDFVCDQRFTDITGGYGIKTVSLTTESEGVPATLGTEFVSSSGKVFVVTSDSKNEPTVSLKSSTKNVTSMSVPNVVVNDGVSYAVTGIADNACSGCSNLKEIRLGQNIRSIGKNCFKNSKRIRKIVLGTDMLNSSSVSKNAFKGVCPDATVCVPKKMRKAYRKLFIRNGLPKKCKFK